MESITRQFLSGLTAVPQIIILIAVLIYISKRSTAEGILMLIGSVIGLISSIFYTFIMPMLAEQYGVEIYQSIAYFGIISTLGALSFAIGLLLLINNGLKRTERKV